MHALGGGWGILIVVALLWFAPKIFIGFLLRLSLKIDQKTVRGLREKYGSAIDNELESKSSAQP